ncbi:MAG: hypothetical protein PQJ61_14395 [Spirochaetales bacterium]|uniref:Uncharacterized protein n=1 Tax=Candidatus Thalassospirochaeta sargassi TaxID=3119039 RepID=A0AAJ1IJ32_9SPIO|nr:hypothetical protein [Spirochaetales bacterium]
MKKTIMVSNSWRPEENAECAKCGAEIEYAWGDYSFRYFESKDKSDLCIICKSCAAALTKNDKKIRVINRSPIMDMINLKNSAWKSQPKRQGKGFSSFGGGSAAGGGTEADTSDESDAEK